MYVVSLMKQKMSKWVMSNEMLVNVFLMLQAQKKGSQMLGPRESINDVLAIQNGKLW